MKTAVRITMLAENTARGRGILGEHGLAYWVETPTGNLLFDTGQGQVLSGNAEVLGIELRGADSIVLSHGHYDHVGGLESQLERSPEAVVYMHPGALQERFTGEPGGGTRLVNEAFLYEGGLVRKAEQLIEVRQPTEVLPGIWATGEVPRATAYEDTGGAFYLDAAGTEPDPIVDDQSIYFRSERGIVLILGCAHAGVVNTMRHVGQLTGEQRLYAVIGGMHLLHATADRLAKTYAVFEEMKVDLIAPCHCTGIRAVAGFWNQFPNRCVEAHAGKRFNFNLDS